VDLVFGVIVCLALWWLGFSLLLVRDRSVDAKAALQLTPAEKEKIEREIDESDADLASGFRRPPFFSKAHLHEFAESIRADPKMLIILPFFLSSTLPSCS
jgi:hypothetical protein